MQGLFLCNKPIGLSSAQFLGALKRTLRIPRTTRVGHGGTLDPFAEGLLVVGITRTYTKLLHDHLNYESKEYEVEIVLGASSDTDDKTGVITPWNNNSMQQVTSLSAQAGIVEWRNKIKEGVEKIAQQTKQTPPQYSATKLQGKPAYERARSGEVINIEPKHVTVYKYAIESIEFRGGLWVVRLTMTVSAGFYIRSFARDIGAYLGIGGYVEALKRTKTGHFSLKNALNLDDFGKTMTLYIQPENRQKIGDLETLVQGKGLDGNIAIKHGERTLNLSGLYKDLEKILIEMHISIKEHNLIIRDWFGI